MSYQPYYPNGWQSGKTGGTPITPAALQHMENGIKNSAPAGYGLGTNSYNEPGTSFTTKEQLDAISGNSFFSYRNPDVYLIADDSNTRYVYGVQYQYSENFAKQIAVDVYNGTVIERNKVDDEWRNWEYSKFNFVSGHEYRTTERHLGKAVYAKLINCGAVVAGEKILTITTNATAVIRYSGAYVGSDGKLRAVPWLNPTSYASHFIDLGVQANNVYIYGGTAYGNTENGTLYLQVWYTKY